MTVVVGTRNVDSTQSRQEDFYHLASELANLRSQLEDEKQRGNSIMLTYEDNKTEIIERALESERSLRESCHKEHLLLLSAVRDKDCQVSRLTEKVRACEKKVKYFHDDEGAVFDERAAVMARKIKNLKQKLLNGRNWKDVCLEMSEITVRMCTGALTIPEFPRQNSNIDRGDTDADAMSSDSNRGSPGNHRDNKSSKLFYSLSHGQSDIFDFLERSSLAGNVLVQKDYLSTLLLLSKVTK